MESREKINMHAWLAMQFAELLFVYWLTEGMS